MAIESQWVTFRTGNETYGIEIQFVQEMLRMPQVHSIPQMPADNLGVVLLRAEVLPVFDLNRKFGLESQQEKAETMISMLQQRQQDHENWLNELKASVDEHRPFTLTTDPHACAFGKWFDTFESSDREFMGQLRRFDEPHKKMHAVAVEVGTLQRAGEYDRALELIQHTRAGVMESMIKLFTETMELVSELVRPSLIVVGSSSCRIAIAVDEIRSVIRTTDDEIQAPDSIPGCNDFAGLIGLLGEKNSHKLIMLLDPAELFPQLMAG